MTEIHQESLSRRVVRSGFWVFALRITDRVFYLTRLIILARILSPHDFGLLGIAMLAMLTLENFSQTGFQAALIQKKENIENYLNSAWTIGILRGVVLFSILYFIAPYVAAFFNVPPAKSIIQVISLSILLQAFTNIGVVYFQKELEFNKQFIYQLSGTLVDFIVAVSAAFILRSVWALVFGLLAGNAARFIASYLIHPYRPHLSFNLGKAKELFGFGKWVLGSSILIFLITQGDDAFVGKLLGATMLGFYQMAYRISSMPATEITHVISQVTFPAYSKLQDNIPKLREAYLKVLQLTAFLSFPIAGLIFIFAPDFTTIFLGEKWMPMVPAMQVLCFFGVTRSISATMGPILYSMDRPKILTKFACIQLIMIAIIIYPLTIRWDIMGASLAILIPTILAFVMVTREVKNMIGFSYRNFLSSLIAPFIGMFMMFLIALLKHNFLLLANDNVNLLITLFLCGSIYIVIIYIFDKNQGFRMLHEAQTIIQDLTAKQYDNSNSSN